MSNLTLCILSAKILSNKLKSLYEKIEECFKEGRKTLVLNKKTGRDCKVLKRRTYGTYCTTCYDEVLFRATDPNCTECHGTGFKTGYFPAISMKAMINAAPKYNQITMFGESLDLHQVKYIFQTKKKSL